MLTACYFDWLLSSLASKSIEEFSYSRQRRQLWFATSPRSHQPPCNGIVCPERCCGGRSVGVCVTPSNTHPGLRRGPRLPHSHPLACFLVVVLYVDPGLAVSRLSRSLTSLLPDCTHSATTCDKDEPAIYLYLLELNVNTRAHIHIDQFSSPAVTCPWASNLRPVVFIQFLYFHLSKSPNQFHRRIR